MNTVYLLGSGFTHAIFNSAPLNDEIMPRIDMSKYPEFDDIYTESCENIELFLTLLDIKLKNTKTCESDKQRLKDACRKITQEIANQFDLNKLGINELKKTPSFRGICLQNPCLLTYNFAKL